MAVASYMLPTFYPAAVKKFPALMAGDIDKYPKMGYSIGTKGATSRRLPPIVKEK